LITERKTNNIKVLIWWEDYTKKWGQVNSILALRQPWSAIKPFTYLLAFKNLELTPDDTIIDEPVQFFTEKWYAYTPKNYSLEYKGKVTFAQSLSQSINIPAVKLTNELWVWNLLIFLKEVWINSLNKDSDFYGLALTLWVWEVNLYELLRAYSIFSNDWVLCDFNITLNQNKNTCKNIVDKKYTQMIESILTNRYFKLAWFPINSSLDFPDRYVFVKTWTSRNFNDNWALWFSENYMIWVWVWNKDWTEMKWVSWASWAWEIFRSIVYELENNNYENITQKETKNNEKYLEITNPLDWSVYSINHSKPMDVQNIKLDFKTNMSYEKYYWEINWKKIDWDLFNIKSWNYDINLKLIDKNKIINSKKSKIKILE
jgi:penicillin-binding protein 1C